jgi:ABC-2 type transport system ATP-binding protein
MLRRAAIKSGASTTDVGARGPRRLQPGKDGAMVGVPVVSVEGLRKQFGDVTAVDDFALTVEQGEVCGLLGPNGAGKTTTLRVLMGLERASRGEVRLFGVSITPSNPVLRRVGAMIEEAAFIPHLSGRANLRLWWEAAGGHLRDADVDGALAVAGLDTAIDRKVRTYSQGMKQRLGFARLLLGRPELLVLDEPTNGLDPGEIREIRALIRRLTDRGATVLLSSHHLAEVEQVCSHVVVMNKGRLVSSGRVDDLIGSAGSVYVEVDDTDRARAVIAGIPNVSNVNTQGNGLVLDVDGGRRSDVASALVGAGLRLETIMPTQRLEDAFLDLLDDESSEAPR